MTKLGAKLTYDEKMLDKIIEAISECKGSLGQVADRCMIPRNTFYDWLKRGEKEREEGIDSELAQLSGKVKRVQSDVVVALLTEALKGKRNSKFIQWWLSICFRADFGQNGEEIQKLFESFLKLREHVERYTNSPMEGLARNGEIPIRQKVDSKGNQ